MVSWERRLFRFQELVAVIGKDECVVFARAAGEIPELLGGRDRAAVELLDQELRVAFRYWEGSVRVMGTGEDGRDVAGRGYAELTGYAGTGS